MRIILLTILFYFTGTAVHKASAQAKPEIAAESFTLVYDIIISTPGKKAGIEETYNGGIRTIMKSGNHYRLRQVSLMRIQNLYFYDAGKKEQQIILSKESGQRKYQQHISTSDWNSMNAKYDEATYTQASETLHLLGYTCKKMTIALKSGQLITAYYSPALPALHKVVEPMFEKIPGLVLQYEISNGKGKIKYVASKMIKASIDEQVFKKPGADYPLKKRSATINR